MSEREVKDPWETLIRQEGSVKIVRDGSSSAVAIPWWELLGAGIEMNWIETVPKLLLLLLLLLLNVKEKAEWDERKRYKLPDDNSHPL